MLSQRDSFAQWADDWLRVKSAAEITDKQKANYERGVKAWKEALAGYEIGQIRADDIERSLVEMQEDGYAARTVNFYRSTIRQIMAILNPEPNSTYSRIAPRRLLAVSCKILPGR